MQTTLKPLDPGIPIKTPEEILRDNPHLPAGAKAHLRAWVRGDLHQSAGDAEPAASSPETSEPTI